MAFDNDEQQSEYFKNFYNLHKVKIFSAIAVFLLAFFTYKNTAIAENILTL